MENVDQQRARDELQAALKTVKPLPAAAKKLSMPSLGMSVPSLGMSVPSLGVSMPSLGLSRQRSAVTSMITASVPASVLQATSKATALANAAAGSAVGAATAAAGAATAAAGSAVGSIERTATNAAAAAGSIEAALDQALTAPRSEVLQSKLERAQLALGEDDPLCVEGRDTLRMVLAEEELRASLHPGVFAGVEKARLAAARDKARDAGVSAALLDQAATKLASLDVAPAASRGLRKPPRAPPADVGQPTPAHLWWSADSGWPTHGWTPSSGQGAVSGPRLSKSPPSNLTPSAEEAPELRPLPSEVIGELCVEVLQASGLRKTEKIGGHADAYGLVLFEGLAARTAGCQSSSKPRWHPGAARAFRLPITHPSSKLYVALLDDDGGSGLSSDEPLGRVVISLAGMHPRTEFDAWYPLQMESYRDHRGGSLGRLRLRFSLHWTAKRPRAPLMRALAPPPAADLPFRSARYLEAARFAIEGQRPETATNWNVLMAQLTEACALYNTLWYLVADTATALLTWQHPHRSALVAFGWQLLCLYPCLVPATIPLLVACAIAAGHRSSPSRCEAQPASADAAAAAATPAVQRRLGFGQMVRAVVAPDTAPLPSIDGGEPLAADSPLPAAEATDDDEEEEAEEEGKPASALEAAVAEIEEEEVRCRERQRTDVLDDHAGLKDRKEWVNSVTKASRRPFSYLNQATISARRLVTEGLGDAAHALNPIAGYLGPAQQKLRQLLTLARHGRAVVTWEDPMLSAWLLGLSLASALAIGVAVLYLHVLLRLGLQALGLHLLGPQHWLHRVRAERTAAEWARRVAAYALADEVGREKMLIEERARIVKALEARWAAEEAAEARLRERLSEAEYTRDLLRRRLRRDSKYQLHHENPRLPRGPYGETRPDARLACARSIAGGHATLLLSPGLGPTRVAAGEAETGARADAAARIQARFGAMKIQEARR